MSLVRTLGLRLLLPVAAVVVWSAMVGVPAMRMMMELRGITGGGRNATVTVGAWRSTITPKNFWPFAVNDAVVTHSHAITAVYLPGALWQMPTSVATTRPEDWYPKPLYAWTWRALGTLVYSLPAWWLVGLGMDALLGWRRLRWPLAILGSVLCGFLLATLIGYLAGVPESASGWVYAGLGLWIGLFALLPVAGLVQRRARFVRTHP